MNTQESALNSNPIMSIIIPCYNRGQRLTSMLMDIIERMPKEAIEILLSDDSSEENSSFSLLEFSRQFPGTVIYRKNESRLGYAANLIQAIHLSRGEYLFVLMDEDSLVAENLTIFIEDVIENNYDIAISAHHLDQIRNDTLEVLKVSEIDILGLLRHPTGFTVRRELANEALKNPWVLSTIKKVPQYPCVPIGLYCTSQFKMFKYFLKVFINNDDDGNSQSGWTPDGILNHYTNFTSRANQIEAYIEMIRSIISSENTQSFPFIQLQKSALDEQLYMLLEEGIIETFDTKTVSAFYKRSAKNSIKWLLSNLRSL